MKSVIGGWLTSGRSTTRSVAMPSSHHHRERHDERQPEIPAALDQRHEGQRGEEHHRALREVEHARGLVDQHEAERDERVHHAGEQPAGQHLDEEDEFHLVRDAEVGVDDFLVARGLRPGVPSAILRP